MYLPSTKFAYTALQSLIDGKAARRLHGLAQGKLWTCTVTVARDLQPAKTSATSCGNDLPTRVGSCKFWQAQAFMSWGVREADISYLTSWKLLRTGGILRQAISAKHCEQQITSWSLSWFHARSVQLRGGN